MERYLAIGAHGPVPTCPCERNHQLVDGQEGWSFFCTRHSAKLSHSAAMRSKACRSPSSAVLAAKRLAFSAARLYSATVCTVASPRYGLGRPQNFPSRGLSRSFGRSFRFDFELMSQQSPDSANAGTIKGKTHAKWRIAISGQNGLSQSSSPLID
jgi:hypothetical protein